MSTQHPQPAGGPEAAPSPHAAFDTRHLAKNVERKTLSGGVVQGAAQGLQLVFMLGYNVAMARLLTPHEFGLVAMVWSVVGVLQIFRDMGLSTAAIQRADLTPAQASNLFWLNVGLSGSISVLLALASPLVAWFFRETELLAITCAMAPLFVLNGLMAQHVALLNRQMRFLAVSVIDVSSMLVGSLAGIAMAFRGFGYWSLVGTTLTQTLVRATAVWATAKWRPQAPRRNVGTRPLVSFGANLTLSGFIYSASRGCDLLLIGRFAGSHAAGLYSRAATLLLKPIEQLMTPLVNVSIPALSRLQNEPERYRRLFLNIFAVLTIGGGFVAGIAAVLAQPLTLVLLGAKWQEAAVIFSALSVAALYAPLSSATSWLYSSQGRGSDLLKVSVLEAVILVSSVAIGLPRGSVGVAVSLSVSGLAARLPMTFFIAGRKGPVRTADLWETFLKHVPIALVVATFTLCAYSLVHNLSPFRQLLVCAPVGIVAGLAAILLYPPSRSLVFSLLRGVRGAKAGAPA